MRGDQNFVRQSVDLPARSRLNQARPVANRDAATMAHHRGMAFTLQAKIARQFGGARPKIENV